jgi:hypothetical protein
MCYQSVIGLEFYNHGPLIALFYTGRCQVHQFRVVLFLSALFLLTAGVASADTLISYSFTGGTSFELPVNPVPTVFTLGFDFEVTPINLIINGAPSSDFLVFFNGDPVTGGGGGFGAFSCGDVSCQDISVLGPQLYSGPESSPTMLGLGDTGVALMDPISGTTSMISTPGTPSAISTPEPSVTVLLVIGLLAAGLVELGFRPRLAVTPN